VVTAIAGTCKPFVEWLADHVPEKRMGVFGIRLIIAGLALNPSSIGWRCSTWYSLLVFASVRWGHAALRDARILAKGQHRYGGLRSILTRVHSNLLGCFIMSAAAVAARCAWPALKAGMASAIPRHIGEGGHVSMLLALSSVRAYGSRFDHPNGRLARHRGLSAAP
jgi:hypothetical protein